MSTNLYEESPTGVQMAETQQMVEGWNWEILQKPRLTSLRK